MSKFKRFCLFVFVLLLAKLAYNVYKPRPIQFDRFSDIGELEKYLQEKYIGQDINVMLTDLVKSEINSLSIFKIKSERDMKSRFNKEQRKKYIDIYDYSYTVRYYTYILSKHSMQRIQIYISVDKGGKIFTIMSNMFSMFE